MASNINANNIDGAFPVAGQDNDSQGFRDNFTNAKNNFSYAKSEIEDLQSKVLLKTALSGDILSNALNDTVLSGAQVLDFSETRVALGTTSGTVTLDHTLGHYQTVTTNGNVTLAFSNLPPAGQRGRIRLQIVIANVAHTLTLPAAVSLGTNQLQGYSSNVITFAATGTYEFEFTTHDAGTAITIFDMSRPGKLFKNPVLLDGSEDLANAGAASLTKTSSYFSTAVAETATLAAGESGQIKTFCLSPPPLALSSVTITGTGGTFSCSATTLEVGQQVTIAGTLGGTGSISGYLNPTSYYIITTNGTTTFTLSTSLGGGAITTTAGTPTGLTYSVVGPMVITVTNAGWKTSGTGTITFDTIGDACTLQYVNSKWFCIGNNGATFA